MSMSSKFISTHSLLQPTALRDMAMPCVNDSFIHSFMVIMEKCFQLQLRIFGASKKWNLTFFWGARTSRWIIYGFDTT